MLITTKTDCGNMKNAIVRKFKKTFVHFFPFLVMTSSGGKKKLGRKNKFCFFPFLTISIGVDDYQVMNMTEG